MLFIPSKLLVFSIAEPIDLLTFSHSSLTCGLFANKLDMLIIANGRPPHFFSILFEICFSKAGQWSSEPNILLKNNFLEWRSLRASISYTRPLPSRQHDLATSTMRVVAIILLEQSFSGKAYLIASHADMDHISSIMMRYLIDEVDIVNQLWKGVLVQNMKVQCHVQGIPIYKKHATNSMRMVIKTQKGNNNKAMIS